MLVKLIPPLFVIMIAATGVVFLAGPSLAGGRDCHVENNIIVCAATDPGHAGSGSPASEDNGPAACSYKGQVIPCVQNGAPWFASQGCYGEKLPDPPAGDPQWSGHTVAEGHLWYCIAGPMAAIPQNTWFVGTGQVPLPDPEVLARRALAQMPLATAEVHTAPAPPHNEVVGVETWLWVPSIQWRTLSRSVSEGPTTVAVTAAPDHVSWTLGDGATKTCYDAGRPWASSMTDAATTDCGYTYRTISAGQPNGLFQLNARITYQVDWTCTGACTTANGTLGQVPAAAGGGQLKSVQRQTVVVN